MLIYALGFLIFENGMGFWLFKKVFSECGWVREEGGGEEDIELIYFPRKFDDCYTNQQSTP